MWTQLIQQAKSKMGHSAQASQRQQNLIQQMQKKEQDEMRSTYSQPIGGNNNATNKTTSFTM